MACVVELDLSDVDLLRPVNDSAFRLRDVFVRRVVGIELVVLLDYFLLEEHASIFNYFIGLLKHSED